MEGRNENQPFDEPSRQQRHASSCHCACSRSSGGQLLPAARVRAARCTGRCDVSDGRCVQIVDRWIGQHDVAGRRNRLALFPDRYATAAIGRDRAGQQSGLAYRGAQRCAGTGAIPDPARRTVSTNRWLRRSVELADACKPFFQRQRDNDARLFRGSVRRLGDRFFRPLAEHERSGVAAVLRHRAGTQGSPDPARFRSSGPVPGAARLRRSARGNATDTRDRAGVVQAHVAAIPNRHGNRAFVTSVGNRCRAGEGQPFGAASRARASRERIGAAARSAASCRSPVERSAWCAEHSC